MVKKLISKNADTLNVLKHINDLSVLPKNLKNNMRMINHALVRTPIRSSERNFFAVYGNGAHCIHMEPVSNGVVLRMNLHKIDDMFSFIYRYALTSRSPIEGKRKILEMTLSEKC